jgi:hypothetical protein
VRSAPGTLCAGDISSAGNKWSSEKDEDVLMDAEWLIMMPVVSEYRATETMLVQTNIKSVTFERSVSKWFARSLKKFERTKIRTWNHRMSRNSVDVSHLNDVAKT